MELTQEEARIITIIDTRLFGKITTDQVISVTSMVNSICEDASITNDQKMLMGAQLLMRCQEQETGSINRGVQRLKGDSV